ncbi:MAG TPA: class I SAM-dependent methyltransferase, partial [Patescibacteria group bacterium]|nr:class I SAM-dependent methyltransferase [Patescibacteria group bacterium]
MQRRNQTKNQSWDNVAPWYDKLTGNSGQYFHEHVIFQNVTRLLNVQKDDRILDLACGQGAYSRELAKQGARVTGVDSSKNLLDRAAHYKSENIEYVLDDARNLHKLSGTHFDAAVSILALQNIDPLDSLFTNVSKLLEHNGAFVIVILHPILRSPRITGWEEDPNRKIQFRRIDRYVTSMKIPITMHPGKTQ